MAGQAESDSYYERHAADLTDWFAVADRDYLELIDRFDLVSLLSSKGPHVRLLDVGCGTGRFPTLLQPHLPKDLSIRYDFLDPVERCLSETERALVEPYSPGRRFETTLDRFEPPPDGYDVVWSVHSMCAVPRDLLESTMTRFVDALAPQGHGLIYLQSDRSFYSDVYSAYRGKEAPPLSTAEHVMSVLGDRPGVSVEVRRFEFEHRVPQKLLSTYLSKCVFDDAPLDSWLSRPELASLLEMHSAGHEHVFPQSVWLLELRRLPVS